jgi:hypothetical protein
MTTKKRLEAARRQKQKQVTSLSLMGAGILVLITMIAAILWKGQPGKNAAETAPDGSGAASLKVNQEKIDLGNVKLGKEVSVSFTLTNDGNSPLKLTKDPYIEVAAGC